MKTCKFELQWPAILVAALAVAGCSPAEEELPPRCHVEGRITYNGQPLAGATITFWPLPVDTRNWRAVRPIAVVEADGTFRPNSYAQGDGAVAGEYALTVIYRRSRTAPDLFGKRYSDPRHPVLKVTIQAGDNPLPPIELTGPPVDLSVREADSGQ